MLAPTKLESIKGSNLVESAFQLESTIAPQVETKAERVITITDTFSAISSDLKSLYSTLQEIDKIINNVQSLINSKKFIGFIVVIILLIISDIFLQITR
jgi:hypothetical protein